LNILTVLSLFDTKFLGIFTSLNVYDKIKIFTNLNTVNKNVNLVVPQKLPKIVGCDFCSQTGYKGRLVIDEVIVVDQTFKRMILEEKSSVDLIALVRKDGFITMREDGFIKISKGLTTLEEVHRVTNIAI